MQRKIAILGATGSIGTQALDIARRHPDKFTPVCLTAQSSSEKLFALAREFRPRVAALEDENVDIPEDLRFCKWVLGKGSSARALSESGADDALCAIVGIAGLDAVWTALDVCERVLLANKEALVTGGELVMAKSERLHRQLLPVDSEHSAIFQCLQAANGNMPERLILTASGGALREWDKKDMPRATKEDVLRHPTWVMGAKVTVDCATMLNKGLEVIEAHYLFNMPIERIDVVIHPQSVIHSMVEFRDGAVLAQLGSPDMRGPIGYAMGFPDRIEYGGKRLDFAEIGKLTFDRPDTEKYPCLGMVIESIKRGGSAPVVMNGANEAAVDAFLNGRIEFGKIPAAIDYALSKSAFGNVTSIEDVYCADAEGRRLAAEYLVK